MSEPRRTPTLEELRRPDAMVDPAEIKLPWSLYLLGWGFIAVGCHSLVRIVVGFFYGWPVLDLGVVAIFAGRGLLQLRDGWRRLIIALVGLTLFVGGPLTLLWIAVGVFWCFLGAGNLVPEDSSALGDFLMIVFLGAIGFFAPLFLVFRILSSERADLLFEANRRRLKAIREGTIPPTNQRSHWQFDVSTLLMLMIVVSLVFGCLVMEGFVLTFPTTY